MDAAVNLAKAGKQCTVLASTATWNVQDPDPSTELAPYTADRLREVTAPTFSPSPKLLAPLRVDRVEKAEGGGYNVVATWQAAENMKLFGLRKGAHSSSYFPWCHVLPHPTPLGGTSSSPHFPWCHVPCPPHRTSLDATCQARAHPLHHPRGAR